MFSFNLQRFARVMTVVDGKVVEFLPVATTSDRGGVVIGDGVSVDNSGKISIPESTTVKSGLISSTDKTKLNGIANGAQVNVIEKVQVNNTDLAITNKSVNIDISNKVDKVSGKTLSSNDYTTTEKNKLSGIASGAQVNVIEKISIDGVNQSINSKTATLNLDAYAKKSDIASGIRIKGSVNSFSDLPTDAVTGDLYNIKTAGGTDGEGIAIRAGDNVVRTENGKWDVMAGTVDLSNYIQKDGSKVLSTNDYTTTEKNKLAGIASGAQVNVIETVKVNGTALTPSSKAVNIDISGKVDKVSGKALSTNDYTTTEKNKLANIASGAQVNVIETIKVNGTTLNVSDKSVNIDISGKVDKVSGKALSTNDYTTTEKNKLAGIDEQANKYILPVATSSTIGGVKIDSVANSNIVLGADGSASVPTASTSQAGVIKYGGGTSNYLRADGQWATPPNTTYAVASQSANGLMSASDKKTLDSVSSVYLTKTDASNTYLGKTAKAASATTADNATKATKDGSDRVIVDTYETKANAITGVAVNGKTLTFTKGDGATVTLQTQDNNTTYKVANSSNITINGTLVPSVASGTTNKYLRSDGTWQIPPDTNTTYSQFSTTAAGLAPKSDGATNKYLRADGTWQVPPDNNTTYKVASSSNITINGTLIPSIASGTTNKYLRSDGTWQIPPDTNTTYKLFNSSNCTVNGTLIPSVAASTTGKYLQSNGTWAIPPNTNYSAMSGASSSAAGAAGLVPAPAKGKQTSFLRGDGNWAVPTNTTYAVATESANGLLSSADKKTINGLANTYLGKTAKAASATTADSATTATKATGDKNGADITTTYAKLAGAAFTGGITGTTATFSGTLTLTKTTDLSGTANNSPALIIGGAATKAHIEIDGNEIHAKGNDSTIAALYINSNGGTINIGEGGISVKGDISAAGKTITAGTFKGNLTGNVTGNVSGSSGSCTGNSATTTKLATGRTLKVSLSSTAASTAFDGSANISNIGVAGILPVANGGTGTTNANSAIANLGRGNYIHYHASSNTYMWSKVGTCLQASGWFDSSISFLVQSTTSKQQQGILSIHVATNATVPNRGNCAIQWLVNRELPIDNFVLVVPEAWSKPFELWCKIPDNYSGYNFSVLSESYGRSHGGSKWSLVSSTSDSSIAGSASAPTVASGGTTLSSSASEFDGYAKLSGATFTGNIKVDRQTSGANRIICANNSDSLGIDWTSISGHEIPGFVVGTSTNTFAGLGIINGKNIGGINHLLLQSNGTMVVSGGEYGLDYVRKSGTDKAFNHGSRALGNDYLVLGSDHDIWVNTNAGKLDSLGAGIKTFSFGQNGSFYVSDGTVVTSSPIGTASGGTGTTAAGFSWWGGTCTTAAGTVNKEITAKGFVLDKGAIITFNLKNANTASDPKFNVNNTGAKLVYDGSEQLSGSSMKAGNYTVVYSGSNWQIIHRPA